MAAQFEIHDSRDGQYYAVFRASNGQVVWVTETYTTKESARAACRLIQREGPNAPIVDKTRSAVKLWP